MPKEPALVPQMNNPPAKAAYRCAVYGLIPGAGLLLGPAAMFLGMLGWRHFRKAPQGLGAGHAVAAILLGSLELLSNVVGFWFIAIGLSSLNS